MTYPGLSMWNGSSKIHYFIDFWHSFCWRLWRPCMLLLIKSKGHMSNVHYSGFPKHLQSKSNLYISISQSKLKHKCLRLDTLYTEGQKSPISLSKKTTKRGEGSEIAEFWDDILYGLHLNRASNRTRNWAISKQLILRGCLNIRYIEKAHINMH